MHFWWEKTTGTWVVTLKVSPQHLQRVFFAETFASKQIIFLKWSLKHRFLLQENVSKWVIGANIKHLYSWIFSNYYCVLTKLLPMESSQEKRYLPDSDPAEYKLNLLTMNLNSVKRKPLKWRLTFTMIMMNYSLDLSVKVTQLISIIDNRFALRIRQAYRNPFLIK